MRHLSSLLVFCTPSRFRATINEERPFRRRGGKRMGFESGGRRRSPQEILEEIQRSNRGYLKIFLGAAPGVGKTVAMLREANEMLRQGIDIVVGIVETHGRKGTEEAIGNLPVLPLKPIEYKGRTFYELDVEGVLRRRPQFVVVDELAHTNVPGSKNRKRYEDVLEILEAGISVLTTMNIQHLESLHNTVEELTGVTVNERVPDWILDVANEVQIVDISPEKLIERLKAGQVYPDPRKIEQALRNYFRPENLTILRELALRELADDVDERLEQLTGRTGEEGDEEHAPVCHRILVAVDNDKNAERLIRRGWRVAKRLKGDLLVLHVITRSNRRRAEEERRKLRKIEEIAKDLGAKFYVEYSLGKKPVDVIVDFVKKHGVTQVILGESSRSRLKEILFGSIATHILRKTKYVDVLIVADVPEEEREREAP
ncbi:MAG: Osmosensitive K+ channel histidine kinase KdpD [Brockia lithotrophica]|uniref:Osmosensitive K+ channel histidine kinase KdpD n=1 Tax=Brockia lithotrophica TaxID=933949 RepID=A0A2T5G4T5_9BACL|nr:MAG: Osmosensitive K+ channel histidine kinase KdpD [Brockia lithotrophica]